MNEITYLFGAGASCNAMPLVENFPDRFGYFIDCILKSNAIANKNRFIDDCKKLQLNVKSHLSFDTFFKKLFHRNEEKEIEKNKAILLIFFMFEHTLQASSISEDDERIKHKKA